MTEIAEISNLSSLAAHSLEPIGHRRVLDALKDRLERNRLAHAMLFCGPLGVGKSLAARWLAAAALCASDEPRPCGHCSACLQVRSTAHPDLLLVERADGKKEIGVDLVRDLKRDIGLTAVSGRYKVAIIDEADRLSIASQNGMLKTLEEPPGRSLLLLVTASPGSLLPTVRSRCQTVLFAPLSAVEVARVLRERAGIEAQEADTLAQASDGSPGRALVLRTMFATGMQEELLNVLATLHPARYVPVVRGASSLGRTEPEMTLRLEILQQHFRERVRAASTENAAAAQASLRALDLINAALFALRRRNANRPLLAESLLLRLSRIGVS